VGERGEGMHIKKLKENKTTVKTKQKVVASHLLQICNSSHKGRDGGWKVVE
jgi:hypothetical protein